MVSLSRYLYTTVHYSEHVTLMTCVSSFGVNNTLFSIVAHLGILVVVLSYIVNCYCVPTVLICKTITFHKSVARYRDILDNQDNFIANIKI